MKSSQSIYKEITKIDIRLKPREYSREVLGVICKKLDYRFGSIILVNEKGEGSIFAAYNLPDSYPQLVHKTQTPVLSSPSGVAIKKGKVVAIVDIINEPRLAPWHELLSRFDVKTIVWAPLFNKGKAFGTYNLYDTHKRLLKEEEENILTQLSMIFSMAIISNEYIDEISEKNRELEEEIHERQRVELEMRRAKEKAEAADKVKSEFLANMSHEIRTPMNAIMGFVDILLQEEENPEKNEILSLIDISGKRLMSIITGILDLSDIKSNRFCLEKEKFSIRELLTNLAEELSPRVQDKKLQFDVKIDESVPQAVQGDQKRVNLVIFHLLDNALKFTEKGAVAVDCAYKYDQGNGALIIKISDTGIGIPQAKQEAIFSIFTQVDASSTRKYGGAGLGLAIVAKLAAMMAGKITLESKVGAGSTFTLELELPAAT